MRIAVLSTEGLAIGGAVRATRRLVAGLSQRGHEAIIISLAAGRDPYGIGIEDSQARDSTERIAQAANVILQSCYIDARRTARSNTLFSSQVAGYSFKENRILDEFDIFNIHWVAGFLAPHNVVEFLATGKPAILTLHDMLNFTGGCHYSAGCHGYRDRCTPCPQLDDDVLNLASWTLDQKRRLFQADNVAAIAPSRWLADCAARSGVFAPENIFVIPNAVDTDVFRPTRKPIAKESLGIEPSIKTLLFGSENNREHRKGFDLLIAMLHRLKSDPRSGPLLAEQRIRILVFGEGTEELLATGIPITNLGTIRNDSRLSIIYSAADLLILASREDNLPNIMLEAMSCATPVVSFAIGGVPDVILNGIEGRLIPPFEVASMASAVMDLLFADEAVLAMGNAAREKICSAYHLDVQAAAYEGLFESMLDRTDARSTGGRSGRTETPISIPLPISLNPAVEKTSIGLFLKQQMVIGETTKENERLHYELNRVRHVLGNAARDILNSNSWRYTRPLRRGISEPDTEADASLAETAATVLGLLRSISWDVTAPLRLAARSIREASRKGNRNSAACKAPQTVTSEQPTSPSSSVVYLDSALLAHHDRPVDGNHSLNPVCLHLYHLDLWDEFKTALKPVIDQDTPLYISLPESNAHFINNIYKDIDEQYCRVFELENRGLDIFPFLFQFKFLLEQGIRPLTLTKIHTKKSIHHVKEFADTWRTELYRKLLANHNCIVDKFEDKTLGMVCSRNWWVYETPGNPNYEVEQRVIDEACKIFNVTPTYGYVAGSMYTISFDYLKWLFSEIDLEQFLVRFEAGYKPSDTLAHGMERVVCFGLEKYACKVGLI